MKPTPLAIGCRALLVLGAASPLAALAAAEAGPPAAQQPAGGQDPQGQQQAQAEPEQPAESEIEQAGYNFNPPPLEERRDIFYDLVAVIRAERQLERIREEQRGTGGPVVPDAGGTDELPPEDRDDEHKKALHYARSALDEIKSLMLAERWESAISASERRLLDLKRYRDQFPQDEQLAQAVQLIRGYRVQAEEKKIYEEARAQFESLGLRIEGIIWSAEPDQESLAIISGEPVARGVDERVRDTVIVNIDPNRVDFMFPYRRREFHFQLYLESETSP